MNTSIVGQAEGKRGNLKSVVWDSSTSDIPQREHRLVLKYRHPLACLLSQSCRWSQTAGKMVKTERTDRGKTGGGGKMQSVLVRNQFRHESGAASHRISSDIDWRGCAHEYSTQNCPPWNVCTGPLQMWENSPSASEISTLYCLSCHADIKGNFLCSCCQRQSILFSVTRQSVTRSSALTSKTCRRPDKRMWTPLRYWVLSIEWAFQFDSINSWSVSGCSVWIWKSTC